MHHLHSMLEDTVDTFDVSSPVPRRFRAATVDEALAQARADLGPDVEILEANQIRRGGVGGFFATDLGVEVLATARRAAARPAASGTGGLGLPTPRPPVDRAPVDRAPVDPATVQPVVLPVVAPPPAAPTASIVPTADAAADDPLFRWFDEMMSDVAPVDEQPAADEFNFDFEAAEQLTESFAAHLDREMSSSHDTDSGFDDDAGPGHVVLTPAPTPTMESTPTPAPVPDPVSASVSASGPPPAPAPAPAPVSAHRVTTVARPGRSAVEAAPVQPPVPQPAAESDVEIAAEIAADVEIDAAAERSHDRAAGLISDALDSLVGKWSQPSSTDVTGASQLRRVEVTLTTADGDVVEMAAEFGAH